MNPAVGIVLTTYNRQAMAEVTVQALIDNLKYDNLQWCLVDDGSSPSYVQHLAGMISGTGSSPVVYDSARRGVGHGMNYGMRHFFERGTDFILMMEDDWRLSKPLDLAPYVEVISKTHYSFIRFGYLAAGLLGYTVGQDDTGVPGKMFWRLEPNQHTYRYTGHPSLRHRRFNDKHLGGCGMFDEGLTPGMTELSMCGKVNKYGPNPSNILIPCEAGQWGFFEHIGADSLADISPG